MTSETLLIVGGCNLDIIGRIHSDFFLNKQEEQDFATWNLKIGGTAVNLAKIAAGRGVSTCLVTMIGDDALGDYVALRMGSALSENLKVKLVKVPNAETGKVVIMYSQYNDENDIVRKVIGSSTSPLDLLCFEDVLATIDNETVYDTILLDGYMFRNASEGAWRFLQHLRGRCSRMCLELVPHQIWRWADKHYLQRLVASFDNTSSSLSTMERIVGHEPDSKLDIEARSRRILQALDGTHIRGRLHLRFGSSDKEGVVFMDVNQGSCEVINYIQPQMDRYSMSTGDKHFIEELFPF